MFLPKPINDTVICQERHSIPFSGSVFELRFHHFKNGVFCLQMIIRPIEVFGLVKKETSAYGDIQRQHVSMTFNEPFILITRFFDIYLRVKLELSNCIFPLPPNNNAIPRSQFCDLVSIALLEKNQLL